MNRVCIMLGVIMGFVLTMSGWWVLEVQACSCAPSDDPVKEADKSSAVFVGKVVQLERDANQRIATLHVSKRWKGDLDPELIVYTALSEASCGFTFEMEKEYLVYAIKKNGHLTTTICSRTKLLSEAQADLDALNKRMWMMDGVENKPSTDTPTNSTPDSKEAEVDSSSKEVGTSEWLLVGTALLLVTMTLIAGARQKKGK
ncbi:hypothetical protein [Thermoactinomyces sp. DSM 45892]|uniref:hypothetical protein n=1 Tax=Thermoactinomyces sp. DSM 45892 TaxID=1882753 RepID=UPI000897F0F6|nr:hypothetical protein [Thermoactinomyces sp. DSM 45892]SDX98390.1 hypothetical protein SAMN05444416_101169 [Thermoactinomyces sp. DSM 45892]